MFKKEKGLLAIFYTVIILLALGGTAQGGQYYINELLEANPPPQVLKEGPIVRVKQPSMEKYIPGEEQIEPGYELEYELEQEPEPQPPPAKPLGKVALTFDDGPDARYTARILDILQAEGVTATFFVVGEYVERYPETLKRIFNDGHLIANHSRTHADLALFDNEDIIAAELEPTSRAVERLTGFYPLIMRPPYGSLRQDSVRFLRENGWQIVRWSLDTFDWDSMRNSPEQILSRIQTQHHNGAIILMHCNGPATTRVLPDLIRILRDLGYEFVAVTGL